LIAIIDVITLMTATPAPPRHYFRRGLIFAIITLMTLLIMLFTLPLNYADELQLSTLIFLIYNIEY
jgi:hypothetical protein